MKTKEIILVGLTINHHTLYRLLIDFLLEHYNNITFLANVEAQDYFNSLDYNYKGSVKFIYEEGEQSKILKRNLALINSYRISIIDEFCGKSYNIFNIKFKNEKRIGIIHNSNKWMLNTQKFYSKYLVTFFFKKRFFDQFDAYITMGPNIKEYLSYFVSKDIFFFPFDQPTDDISKQEEKNYNTINIVVPGKVEERRRKNKAFLDFLSNYYSKNPDSKIKIKLLGKLSLSGNDSIKSEIQKINQKYGNKISFWEHFIPADEFESEIASADFILSNLNVVCNMQERMEVYGLTKESGISFIIYRFAKVGIIPDLQKVLSGFENQFLRYKNHNELFDVFTRIENNRISIESLKGKAILNSNSFKKLTKNEQNNLMNYLKK